MTTAETTTALSDGAQLALDTVHQRAVQGIPSKGINVMEHAILERVAGAEPGAYRSKPEKTYLAFQKAAGACVIDQWIPRNPLGMGDKGFAGGPRGATTGLEQIVVDERLIDSPEAVAAHLEEVALPRLERAAASFDEDARVAEILAKEAEVQALFGGSILKTGYQFVKFPKMRYGAYGYENYFMAYALYPDVIERHFARQADVALLNNAAAARAYAEGALPPLYRLDHDMADGRGTLVDIASLDRIWFPHFARCLAPMLKTDVRMIWHCDGNLMEMVPRLIEAGVRGFQGFQYEHGMDYKRICAMKDRNGDKLIIQAGVSVTTTLPHGTARDVGDQMKWLVENGPRTGLFLGCSSSVAPGVPWENIETLIEGFKYYQQHGRS